jgi:hypothetical protein
MSNPLPKVRILDTPGLADTRSIGQDELHKKNIATLINQYSHSIIAILFLANGTVPRVTVGSTLSAIFSGTPFEDIAFLLTNTSNILYQNFSADILPAGFKGAPQFLLDNPIALQRAYLKLRGEPNTRGQWTRLRKVVKTGEKEGLEMLVGLFDWLDGLEQQGTTEVVKRSQKREAPEHQPSDSGGPSGGKEGKIAPNK